MDNSKKKELSELQEHIIELVTNSTNPRALIVVVTFLRNVEGK